MALAKAKIIAAVLAAALLLAAGVGVLVTQRAARVPTIAAGAVNSPAAPASPATAPSPLVWIDPGPSTQPAGAQAVTFLNALIAPIGAKTNSYFTFDDDASVKRQPDGAPAA